MKTLVVVPVYNGQAFMRACFAAVLAQEYPSFDVLAVDNGSTDGAPDLIALEFPRVRLQRFAQPLGFSGAANVGLRAALDEGYDAVVLLNQDTEVDAGWLAALLQPLIDDPALGVVGSLARFPDGRIQHAGGELTQPLGYGRNSAAGEQALPADLPAPDYMAGLATALRVALLREVGLFDEGFNPAYFEDADLCLRARAAGWGLALARNATLVHHEGASEAAGYRHTALLERNRVRLALKHRPVRELLETWFPAEAAQLGERATEGSSQALRQGYLRALIDLPALAAARGLTPAEQRDLAAQLGALRDQATLAERASRLRGLLLPPSALVAPAINGRNGHAPEPLLPTRPPFSVGQTPPVAIIMLTWNGLAVTRDCVESIRTYTKGVAYTLVVVDNGSTDGTREWLAQQADIELIANAENVGFTKGNNQGLAAVGPEYDVLLLNNDTLILQDHWLAHLRDVANGHADYGVVGCTLLRADSSLQHAGTYMPVSNFWGYQIGGGETFVGQYPGVREVEGVVGAAMYIRRDVRATIGGLDEDYFSYYEDTDYCLRARQAGWKVVCTGGTQIKHLENTSTKLNNVDWLRMFSAAQKVFLQKWRGHYEQRYSQALLWHSLVSSPTGYATSSREFVLELDRRGVDVRLACIFGTDYTEGTTADPRVEQMRKRPKDNELVQVVYSQGDAFIKNSGRYRVGYTMLEADGLPFDWVVQANGMDEVWVPSRHNQEVFAASGVRRPIHVVPLGVDTDHFHPQVQRQRPSDRFVFLSIFEWIERKAPEVLLKAYAQAFSAHDNVLLILKIFNHDRYFDVRRNVAELAGTGGPPITLLLNHEIPGHQMGAFYAAADCFVLPTRGEGWGMPILEAMACGLPTIATDWGAQRDFFHEGVGYPLQIKGLVPAIARSPYYAGLRWADPDVEHLQYLMRYVYEHPDEARALGEQAAREVAARWTWAHATDKIMHRLKEIEG
jgi:GT2 family glycosyltransferase/glycosyltransferase involved in cell wall biosynthesis